MRQILFGLALAFSLVGGASAQLPDYRGKHVDDIDHMLTADQDAILEHRVMAIENSMDDRPQVFVVLMNTVPHGDLASFKTDLFKHWGIGQKGKDNGILFILTKLDRQVGYEVGYGLEHRITDADTAEFTANNIKPNLKRGEENWYKAVSGVVDDIDQRLTRTTEARIVNAQPEESDFNWMAWIAIGLSVLTIFWFVGKRRRANKALDRSDTIHDRAIFRSQPPPRPTDASPSPYVPHPPRMPPQPMNAAPQPPASPRSSGNAAGVVAGAVFGAAAASAARRREPPRETPRRRDDDPSSSSSSSWSSPPTSSPDPSPPPSSDPGGGSSGGAGSTDTF